MEPEKSFWRGLGVVILVVGLILASFAIDGLLDILAGVPIIGPAAQFVRHLLDKAY